MIKLLLGLDFVPSPDDVADALAVAICHAHAVSRPSLDSSKASGTSWRKFRPLTGSSGEL
jgi:hypothetical protein